MKFTATQVIRDTKEVFDQVEEAGGVIITSRHRKTMHLITEQELNRVLQEQYRYGFEQGIKRGEGSEDELNSK